MKRLTVILIVLMSLTGMLSAEDLTLSACYEKAERNHPLQQELQNRQSIYHLKRKNLNAAWLPSISLAGNAVYQSDVADIGSMLGSLPIALPAGISSMPHEQYKITLEVKQTLFDGGAVRAGRQVEQASLEADLQALQTEFYSIHSRINQVYFALLMLEKQQSLAALYHEEVLERKKAVRSGVRNGVVLPADLDILEAALLKAEQTLAELGIQQQKARIVLSELIGEPIGQTRLVLPSVQLPPEPEINRPELALFSKQKTMLDMNKKAARTELMPKVAFFGTWGYGQPPGNNFFNNGFDTYYTVGAALSWSFFNWNTTGRTIEMLQAQQNIIDARETNFRRQIRIALENSRADINRVAALLKTDQQLIILRGKIKKAAASKLNNGTISSTEFLTELNAEQEALISFELHKIQLVQAKIGYLTITGQTIK